jgi:catalase
VGNVPGLYEQLIEAANAIYGSHPGRRAFHAKGVWCEGTFTATSDGARLTRAAHMRGDPVPALIRFSHASGDPEAHDAERNGRGMAVKLRLEGQGEMDFVTTMPPVFATRTPEDFLALLNLRRPDPETGQPDMEALGAFLAAHPEAGTSIQAVMSAEPPASVATVTYHSPHAFRLVNDAGEGTWVRWSWRPEAGEQRIPDDEARERGRDYLHDELAERLRSGTAVFELVFQLAGDDDPLEDPTAPWPEERERVVAARLEVTDLVDDPERAGHIDVFDPLRLVDGIEPSDDPVLHARPKAYSVSAYKRWDRKEKP